MGKFKDRFKELRVEKKLSQAVLAERLGLSRSAISMYEQGEREPDFKTLEKIADYFHVDTDYLLGRKNFISPEDAREEPAYDDVHKLLARNGTNLSTEEKMKLIKMLSEL